MTKESTSVEFHNTSRLAACVCDTCIHREVCGLEDNNDVAMTFCSYRVEKCGDCIRRSDIGLTDFEIVMCNGDYKEGLKMLLDKIEKAPSVTPQPKMGQWIRVDKDKLRCSVCEVIHLIAQYPNGKIGWCPNCGCKMQEV